MFVKLDTSARLTGHGVREWWEHIRGASVIYVANSDGLYVKQTCRMTIIKNGATTGEMAR